MAISGHHLPFIRKAISLLPRLGSALMLGRHFAHASFIEFAADWCSSGPEASVTLPSRVAQCFAEDRGFFEGPDDDPVLEPRLSGDAILAWFGFETIDSVDVSEYEGASVIFDLNLLGLSQACDQTYDFIFDGGTLEHIFHTPNALQNVAEALNIGGVVLHTLPMNNAAEHGFYQFSPTLLADWYSANHFIIEEISMSLAEPGPPKNVIPYQPDNPSIDYNMPGPWSLAVIARKTEKSTSKTIPQQNYYARNIKWSRKI